MRANAQEMLKSTTDGCELVVGENGMRSKCGEMVKKENGMEYEYRTLVQYAERQWRR